MALLLHFILKKSLFFDFLRKKICSRLPVLKLLFSRLEQSGTKFLRPYRKPKGSFTLAFYSKKSLFFEFLRYKMCSRLPILKLSFSRLEQPETKILRPYRKPEGGFTLAFYSKKKFIFRFPPERNLFQASRFKTIVFSTRTTRNKNFTSLSKA